MSTRTNKDSKINPIHGEDFDVEVYQKSVITKLLQCKDEESQSELIDELTYATTCNKNGWATIRTPFSKEEDIVVGAKFYYENDMMGMSCDVRLMTVTYIRSGIVFYTEKEFLRLLITSISMNFSLCIDYFLASHLLNV